MMTIVTHIQLKEGTEHEWDAVMRKRLAAAKKQPGWVGGHSSGQAISRAGE